MYDTTEGTFSLLFFGNCPKNQPEKQEKTNKITRMQPDRKFWPEQDWISIILAGTGLKALKVKRLNGLAGFLPDFSNFNTQLTSH